MATSNEELKPERYVDTRLKRGEARVRNRAAKVNLCFRMWHGDQYCYVNSKNALIQQNVSLDPAGGKPRHRMRQAHGATLLIDSVEHEVSFSTQRIPGYQVIPSNVSPQSIGAAKLAEKVARFGYDQWRLREVRERAVTSAVVAGEGFAWPFWDDQLGPPIPGTNSCVGDVRVRTYHPNEVMWEPGVRFEESAWHAIKQARPLDEIRANPDFIEDRKNALRADAQTNDLLNEPVGGDARNMAFVTEYLERPSPKAPQGRWLTYSNDRLIYPERTYPCVDGEGKTVDEPVLHALQRIVDPAGDRAMGLVEHAIDPIRTYNNCWNKQLEWINLTLIPQWMVPMGASRERWTDEPGARLHYNPIGGLKPERVIPPPIPGDLEGVKQGAADEVRRLFASADVPSGVDAARAIQALIDRDENRRAGFVARLAAFDARMMRHCAAGETLVHTIDGLVPARDLAGQTVRTLTRDGFYRPAEWKSYGTQQLWRVEFDNGEVGHYTQGHEWIVYKNGKRSREARVTTDGLAGHHVPQACRAPGSWIEDRDRWEDGVRNGLIYGDGHAACNTYKPTGRKYEFSRMRQYGDDGVALVQQFFRHGDTRESPHLGVAIDTACYPPSLKRIPDVEEGRDYILGFIAGALAADGRLNKAGMVLTSVNRYDLIKIRMLAGHVGLLTTSIGRTTSKTGYKPNHEAWHLAFSSANFVSDRFVDDALVIKPSHREKLSGWVGRVRGANARRVKSVQPTDRVEEVFCCEEPVTHSWVAESGYVTSNCIYLVQRYYKEPRLLQIRGQWGPENLQDFTGADLRGQADIQVLPQSIEPRTREAVEQRVMNYAQLGWVTPEKAMEAIEAGTAETLIESYELDVARANRVIQRILKGPTALFGGQPAPDPQNVQQGDPQTWPEWMPRPFDNLAVHKSVFSDFMKTSEYDTLPPPMTTAVNLYYQAVEQLDSQQQAQAQQAQAQQAAQMGITNAARPAPANTPLPSLPAVNGGNGNGNGGSAS